MSEEQIRSDERLKIVAWLNGLENALRREICRNGDETMKARFGIYEGIAQDILGGAHKR